jgi:hypothetical protein
MDPTLFVFLLVVVVVLSGFIGVIATLLQQESTNETHWCYGCRAWMRDVEPYWYDEGRTRVLSPLCPDCAFERHATLPEEDGLPLEQSL